LSIALTEIAPPDFADVWPNLWAVIAPTLRDGDAFALPNEENAARAMWSDPGRRVFAAIDAGQYVGTYFFGPNQKGPGAHVANAGYIVAPEARGKGLAQAMCRHSLDRAREQGFRAMQFNIVVSTNPAAIRAWTACGFSIVGTLPGAFAHPALGFVDAYVMHRTL
jgi:RimJ/RimL family protein N-acetyltransferase